MRQQVVLSKVEQRSWHKSSYSGSGGGDCVEVAEGEHVLIRDTQHREHGHLSFEGTEWTHLLDTLKH